MSELKNCPACALPRYQQGRGAHVDTGQPECRWPVMTLADGTEVRSGLYVRPRGGMSLFKISTVYANQARQYATAVVCRDGREYVSRTQVRSLTAETLGGYEPATATMINRYHEWLDHGNQVKR